MVQKKSLGLASEHYTWKNAEDYCWLYGLADNRDSVIKLKDNFVSVRREPMRIRSERYDLDVVFFFDKHLKDWIKAYIYHTRDFDFNHLEFTSFYPLWWVKELNEYKKEEREEKGEQLLGDSIIEEGHKIEFAKFDWYEVPKTKPTFEINGII